MGKFVLFADDTNIFVASDTKDKVYDMANKVLEAVSMYMMVNLLHINAKKAVICTSVHSNKVIKNQMTL